MYPWGIRHYEWGHIYWPVPMCYTGGQYSRWPLPTWILSGQYINHFKAICKDYTMLITNFPWETYYFTMVTSCPRESLTKYSTTSPRRTYIIPLHILWTKRLPLNLCVDKLLRQNCIPWVQNLLPTSKRSKNQYVQNKLSTRHATIKSKVWNSQI